jgi:phage/plasmid-associated DNA primase
VHLVPFDAEFTGPKENNNLEEELKAEASGIMHLLVQACVEWQAVGLAPPKRVSEATAQLFNDLDPIGRFAKECLIEDPDCFLSSDELTTAYGAWLDANDAPVDGYVQRDLIGRLKALPGMKSVTRVKDGARRKGLVGRKLIDTRHP